MPRELATVLGIDAAWTDGEPSGVALLERSGSRWKCLHVAPSYSAFCNDFGWRDRCSGAAVDVSALLAACRRLDAADPVVVAVDMPLATVPIYARRRADNVVSRQFGHRKCSVHSPTQARPGPRGQRLHDGFSNAGYVLATTAESRTPALIEVYPHVALLALLECEERCTYKVSKTNRYWPGKNAEERKRSVIEQWRLILDKLRDWIDGVELELPDPNGLSFEHLKRYEDAIDGLICAWTATQFVERAAIPLGDGEAAIWIPSTAMRFAKDHGA